MIRSIVCLSIFLSLCIASARCAIAEPDPVDWISSVPAGNRRIVPSHASTVRQNPPSFWWSAHKSLLPNINFTLSLWANVSSIDNVPPQWTFTTAVNYLNIPHTLPVGTNYLWQVTRVNITAGTGIQSAVRSFYLTPTASPYVIPATLIADVKASAHPRLLMKGTVRDTWLASSIGASFQARLAQNSAWTSKLVGAVLPAAPTKSLTDYVVNSVALVNDTYYGYYVFTRPMTFELAGLIYAVWYTPGNVTLVNELKRRTLVLTDANPSGVTSHAGQDQANRAILLALAQSYDLISASFTELERVKIRDVIVNRGTQIYNAYAQFNGLLTFPHDSHGANTLGFMAMVSAAMLGTIPEADGWASALPMYLNLYSAWSAEDGGFANSMGYAYWDAYSGTRWDILEWATGVKMTNKQFIFEYPAQFVYFAPYAATRGGIGFGDDGEKDMVGALPTVCNNMVSRVVQTHPDHYEAELYTYYCSQIPNFKRILDFRYDETIWSADFVNVSTLTKTYPKSIHLKTAGWAAFHSSLTDYNRTALFFRASKYGSYNHNNADQLSFAMIHKGQQMFIASGYYDSYMSPHHKFWRKTTRAQSGSITMDGGVGQGFDTMEASASITQYDTTDKYDYVTADAAVAYNAGLATDSPLRLTRAIRSLVYLRGVNQFLIFDQFDAVSPRTFEWNIHAFHNFTVDSSTTVRSTRNGASTCVTMLSASTAFTFTQTDQFPVNATIYKPNQAHGRFTLDSAVSSAAFVVLIDPDCTGHVPAVTRSGSSSSFSVGEVEFIFDGDSLQVIPPPSATQPDGSNPSTNPDSARPGISGSNSLLPSIVALIIVFLSVLV